ncbi:hypothetical protein BAUCODRAFT_381002 [Baudoinia panamericana UAMH 10762]|uniref:Adhesin domain-containing protein n=1 Tax=Baudoinia panamericana (strain UAMH 10762) TaxID=717646 RepID=M2NHJ0_BAUPA|nr:uncharacterized protein BAUCODRAFT_381002 [Baudoinia panamericana UAMH 10762]EMC98819.1 hypothetical protein BAUCODRAFT_381002 [Baudoinia panamericana UAMH 10762]
MASQSANEEAQVPTEETPLLSNPRRAIRKPINWLTSILTLIVVLTVTAGVNSIPFVVGRIRYHDSPRPHLPPKPKLPPPPGDSNLNYTRHLVLPIGNISQPANVPVWTHINVLESLNGGWIKPVGNVRLARGDLQQASNFIARIDLAGPSQRAIDLVNIVQWSSGSRQSEEWLYISCKTYWAPGEEPHWDQTVRVDVTLFVKPFTNHQGRLTISTQHLNINVMSGLVFSTGVLTLISNRGSVNSDEAGPYFVMAETHLSTYGGPLTGIWRYPYKFFINTGDSPTNITLAASPRTQPWLRSGTITAQSLQGDININMPMDQMNLRTHSITIESQAGNIGGVLMVGPDTTIRTQGNGSLNVELVPYFLPSWDFISRQRVLHRGQLHTSTEAGSQRVVVVAPEWKSSESRTSLLSMDSYHQSGSGNLHLEYPHEWEGTALGTSRSGNMSITGAELAGEGGSVAIGRRGWGNGTRLTFATDSGNGRLILN